MVGLSKFVRCQFEGSPFQKTLGVNAPYFLMSSQILFCGIALLGNCSRAQSIALKVFLALFGGTLSFLGVERVIDALSCANLISYPFCEALQSFIDYILFVIYSPVVFMKCWMFVSYNIGLFCKTTTLSVFSLTLLFSWLFSCLIFDLKIHFPDAFDATGIWMNVLDNLILCLNVLVAVWFLGFWKMPIV
ncbi:hypothetical protein [Candidatus Similichlamydia epinepheli]|uniref:hypothetical protein n=1 Tax=Candidatus Similichlamydia epinepheli TaxID=1903953 RepID=UPI000D3D3502|nr:hypothetical protein [Candidatus Similichlamydia epinepheli]